MIETAPGFNPDVETLAVLMLNARRKIKGHTIVSTGILDTILGHAREIYRPAIVAAASAIIVMHNHPSGDPTPSSADVAFTDAIIRAGHVLKLECLDHVIVGHKDHAPGFFSIRQSGLVTF